MAINKEIDLRFVLGYTPLEFRDTLHMLADGKVDAAAADHRHRRPRRRRRGLQRARRSRAAREDPDRPGRQLEWQQLLVERRQRFDQRLEQLGGPLRGQHILGIELDQLVLARVVLPDVLPDRRHRSS